MPFSVSFFCTTAIDSKSLGHRPVDPCLSRQVSRKGAFLFSCAFRGRRPLQSGRNLKGSLRRVVLINACALTCRFLCLSPTPPPTLPASLPLFRTRPQTSPPGIPVGTRTPFETYPGKLVFGSQERVLERGFAKKRASLGYGAVGAKCTPGPNILDYVCFLGRDTGRRNPLLLKPLFFWGTKKHIKKKTRKQDFHGIVPGFWGDSVYVFSPPKEMTRKKHINKFLAPTQSRDNPANLFMFVCFLFP